MTRCARLRRGASVRRGPRLHGRVPRRRACRTAPHRAASARLACAACVRATRGHGRRAGMRARPSSADAATRGGTHRRRRRAAQEARESWR
ncbi:hypothetical protein BURPS668_A3152 [Burkholderia pseudomallei 668]|nr:hypothetical protein BURPS668_A3152 [Burkholderia pseudomallei 668]